MFFVISDMYLILKLKEKSSFNLFLFKITKVQNKRHFDIPVLYYWTIYFIHWC